MNTSKLRHTLAAIIGVLAVVGPQLMNLLGEWKSPKAALVTSTVGFLVALAINGKAVALINLVLPEAPQQAAPQVSTTPTPVTRPETPNAKANQ